MQREFVFTVALCQCDDDNAMAVQWRISSIVVPKYSVSNSTRELIVESDSLAIEILTGTPGSPLSPLAPGRPGRPASPRKPGVPGRPGYPSLEIPA